MTRWSAGIVAVALLLGDGPLDSVPAAAAKSRMCGGVRITMRGTPNSDVLRGTNGNDVIAGFRGNDRILGSGGDDTLCGGAGNDVLRGERGIEFFYPGAGNDRVFGGSAGINVVSYFRSRRPVIANLGTGRVRGWGLDEVRHVHQVVGSRFDDRIVGDARGNALIGLGGNDRLTGSRGEDSLIGGRGDDEIVGGPGLDYGLFIDSPRPVVVDLQKNASTGEGTDQIRTVENLFGSPHDDLLAGNAADNEIIGGTDGDDEILGRGGNDVVFRYYGDTTVDGGKGNRDEIYYEFGGTIDLTSGAAIGAEYSDSITGVEDVVAGSEPHTLVGNAGPNVLVGGGGEDIVRGGPGADHVSGQAGDDVLSGGEGTDKISGGSGADICLEGEDLRECERSTPGDGRLQALPLPRGHRAPRSLGLFECPSWPCILGALSIEIGAKPVSIFINAEI